MGGIIRGDVVDSTDVYVNSTNSADQQKLEQQKAEEERRRREAESKKQN